MNPPTTNPVEYVLAAAAVASTLVALWTAIQARRSVDEQRRLVELEIQDRHLERLHLILNTAADIRGNAMRLVTADPHVRPDTEAIAHIAIAKSRLHALIAATGEPGTFEQCRKLVNLQPVRPHNVEDAKAHEGAAASAIGEMALLIQRRAQGAPHR
jgi:hypothetical protein